MYRQVAGSKGTDHDINLIVIILLVLISIFSYRVINILKSSSERGALAYVQLLNFDMPLVENTIYDEGAYAENKLSVKRVCYEALGLSNINALAIVKNEVPFFKVDDDMGLSSIVSKNHIDPFSLDENSISKVESDKDPSTAVSTSAYDPSLKKELNSAQVEVLIYHTHTTENYRETSGDTTDERFNVVGVGDAIVDELQNNYGIATIHDKTIHCISYNDSYKRSNETVSAYLNKYGDFKLIIDLHRDSVDDKNSVTANINGENVAKLMFVTTKNSKRFSKNQALAEEFFNNANRLFPGLTRKIYTYNRGMNAFNQSLSDGSILIECGANVNTSEEAQKSGRYIARLIAEHINRK
ncbi:MAG: stage II sporulation protein P [Clostridium sp.]|nr:stage II sporulation protein P [Clostridium sp.]